MFRAECNVCVCVNVGITKPIMYPSLLHTQFPTSLQVRSNEVQKNKFISRKMDVIGQSETC